MAERDFVSKLGPRSSGWLAIAVSVFVAITASVSPSARAQPGDDAMKILKAMTDYVSSQKIILATYDTDIEVLTDNLQKIQFASSGQMLLSRPDKVNASRVGGYADVEMVFDGKTLSVLGKNLNKFVQVDAAGSVDELVAKLRDQLGMAIPGADIMLSRSYDELTTDVISAAHIGRGVIDGVECDHLAFRNHDVDWQLWVELGSRPIPRKYVITSKEVTGAPQYTLRIKEWKTDVPVAADAFSFKPPPGAQKVEVSALVNLDEIPQGVVQGEKK
jgi:hypothetical protein